MHSNLYLEIQQILQYQATENLAFPIPSYLFVKCYGRDIEPEMKNIAWLLGYKEWFLFHTHGQANKGSILSQFLVELERRSGAGKSYSGCVLVDLSGEESDKEMDEFLGYIQSQTSRLHCFYRTKNFEEVSRLQKLLSNYGFVRVLEGELYQPYQQMRLFLDVIDEYLICIEKDACLSLEEYFKKKEWQESDEVAILIQNMAKELLYNKLLDGFSQDTIITQQDIQQILSLAQEEPARKRQIGFVMGGN